MTLDRKYLEYPMRRYGMDHDRYDWSILPRRAPVHWPGNAPIALWITVALEFFPLNPQSKPVRLPGGMVTPYPDLRHFTLRDYGNRVGVFRVLRALDARRLRASFAVNARVAERHPGLVRIIQEQGHEIVGHGLDMDHPHHGELAVEVERELVASSLAALRASGVPEIRGWLSPGRSESVSTPELLAAAGVEYFCDWANDDMPYRFRTSAGPLVAMPLSADLDDRQSIVEFCHSEQDFKLQVLDQYGFLKRESDTQGGRILSLTLHPWVIGQPHRIAALEETLAALAQDRAIWSATGVEIMRHWRAAQPDAADRTADGH
jgi:peptidoglycan/xylan/chitin deacetylase (PgdA/CDA1 family)